MPLTLAEKFWRLQNDPAWTTIELPVEPGQDTCEEVLVERVGDKRFRIASSPGMVDGLAANDVIELTPDELCGYRLVRRGQNLCIHLFTQAEQRDRVQAALEQELGRLGGWLDGTMGAVGLCFTVPVKAGFTAVEAAMRVVVGEEWYFSNVYDLSTNQPLNWWLESERPG
jgi:hypothetical protein